MPRTMFILLGPEKIGLHFDDGVFLAPIYIPSGPEPHSARRIALTLELMRVANAHK